MDLVVGGTGWLGSEICRRLRAKGEAVRALVRKTSDPAKVEGLKSLGCEIVTGDLQDKASLDRACRGIDTVISTATAIASRQSHDSLDKTDRDGQINLIEASRANRVKRFVLVSFSGNLEGQSSLHRAKRTVEETLRQSGLAYTILRPSCFMEIWLSPMMGFDLRNRKAQIFGTGDAPVSYISISDVAEFAVLAAKSDRAVNQTIELGGPEAIAPNDVVKMFEQETGAQFEVTRVPKEALAQQFASATDEIQKTFAALTLGIAGGDKIDMKKTLAVFPVKLTSVRDFTRRMLAG
ncbi:MAG TPA: SDR family oxidoreductase [Thermoanaerobaculia bacterium]|nr:SDR family oxidoreductase [Thermoanaerobaculia bacterium]